MTIRDFVARLHCLIFGHKYKAFTALTVCMRCGKIVHRGIADFDDDEGMGEAQQ